MVKLLPLLTLLATLALGANACSTACSAVSETSGHCNYSCTHQCGRSASALRNNFLDRLNSAGYDCSATAGAGIECKKSANFGNCNSHSWHCGPGC
jgi:hypothetical protein